LPDQPHSYLSPKLESRPSPFRGGFGVFAREPVQAGELLAVWGGCVVTEEQLEAYSPLLQSLSVQIEDDLYLVPIEAEAADRVNHSCNPNAGIQGQIALVALRDIQPDEEVCFDYAMTDSSPYDEFKCRCGEPTCRGRITGNDWQIEDLWERYDGFFSAYMRRRINALKRERGLIEADNL
jgi:SET domain-containing protein